MEILKKDLQIAIDGPIGSGKSSLAFILAQRLGLKYIYTGAMYRAVAYLALVNKIPIDAEEQILTLLKKSKMELRKPSKPDRYTDVWVDGQDISRHLFTQVVTRVAPETAKLRKIRQSLVKLQQKLAQGQSVVMEGRDIGTRVLPRADLKIFLTAPLETRARRRWSQLNQIDKPESFAKVVENLKQRDSLDTNRKESPLKKAPGTWILDTAHLSIPGTVEVVLEKLKSKKLIS